MERLVMSLVTGKLVSAAAAVFMFATTGNLSLLIDERQEVFVEAAGYNLTWSVTQAVTELNRFEQAIAESGLPSRNVRQDEIGLRYDILRNRLHLLTDGAAARFFDQDAERRQLIAQLNDAVIDVEPLVADLTRAGARERVLDRLEPFNGPLVSLAAASNRATADRVVDIKRKLSELNHACASCFAAVVIGALVLVLIAFSRAARLRRENLALRQQSPGLCSTDFRERAGAAG
jgi:hypothetical protein